MTDFNIAEKHMQPRRKASSEIKLLRLDLIPQNNSPCEDIDYEWNTALPTENVSPILAATNLGVEVWAPQSVVHKRYRTLQVRYPPEQFAHLHLDWRPSFQLLSNPIARFNWFWKSGLIPDIYSNLDSNSSLIWDKHSVEPEITAESVFTCALQFLYKNSNISLDIIA